MKTIIIPDGVIHIAESKAVCPKCRRKMLMDEIEDKFQKQNNYSIRVLCKCRKYIGITQDILGDYVAYEL